MTHPTVKNKLYDFLDKRTNFIVILMIATFFLGLYNINNEVLVKVFILGSVVPCFLACVFLMLEDTDRKYKKARQLLKDQSDSSSPHWDGQVRYAQDIEPRLKLLQDRIEQDQLEIRGIQIAKEQNKLLTSLPPDSQDWRCIARAKGSNQDQNKVCPCNGLLMLPCSDFHWCPHMDSDDNPDVNKYLAWQELNDIPDWLCKYRVVLSQPDQENFAPE
jgi:hypothetical protein